MDETTGGSVLKIVYIGKRNSAHAYQIIQDDGTLSRILHFKGGFIKQHGKFAGAMLSVRTDGTTFTFEQALGVYPDKNQIRTWQALQQADELADKVQKEMRTNQFVEGLKPYHDAYHSCTSSTQQRVLIATIIETIVRGK